MAQARALPLTLIFLVGIKFALFITKLPQRSHEQAQSSERNPRMLRKFTTIAGSAMAALCLVSSLAIAQPQTSPRDSTANPRQPASDDKGDERSRDSRTDERSGYRSPMMICTQDDRMGNCTAASGDDGRDIVVQGDGLQRGDRMSCVNRGYMVHCRPAS